jgi:uncharacterized protein
MKPISPELIQAIRAQYTLPWRGTHGITHWARVRETGLRLAADTGANPAIVELFAVFHDARRRNEGVDPGHGGRGVDFAATLRGTLIHLSERSRPGGMQTDWIWVALAPRRIRLGCAPPQPETLT